MTELVQTFKKALKDLEDGNYDQIKQHIPAFFENKWDIYIEWGDGKFGDGDFGAYEYYYQNYLDSFVMACGLHKEYPDSFNWYDFVEYGNKDLDYALEHHSGKDKLQKNLDVIVKGGYGHITEKYVQSQDDFNEWINKLREKDNADKFSNLYPQFKVDVNTLVHSQGRYLFDYFFEKIPSKDIIENVSLFDCGHIDKIAKSLELKIECLPLEARIKLLNRHWYPQYLPILTRDPDVVNTLADPENFLDFFGFNFHFHNHDMKKWSEYRNMVNDFRKFVDPKKSPQVLYMIHCVESYIDRKLAEESKKFIPKPKSEPMSGFMSLLCFNEIEYIASREYAILKALDSTKLNLTHLESRKIPCC